MREQKYVASEKKIQRMTRDGLVEDNLATGNRENISKQSKETDFVKKQENEPFNVRQNSSEPKPENQKRQSYKSNSINQVDQQDFKEKKPVNESDKIEKQEVLDNKESREPEKNLSESDRIQKDKQKNSHYRKQKYQKNNISSENDKEKINKLQFKKSEMAEANPKEIGSGNLGSSRKLVNSENKASTTQRQLEQVKKKIPQKKKLKTQRFFDEEKGKPRKHIYFDETEKPLKNDGIVKKGINRFNTQGINYTHRRISEVEKENAGVEATHKGEQALEGFLQHRSNRAFRKRQMLHGKVAKLEQKASRINVNYQYQKFLVENPDKLKRAALNKLFQKQRIKKEYQKAFRTGKTGKVVTQKTAQATTKIMKKLLEIMLRNRSVILIALFVGFLLLIITASFASCSAMFSNSVSTIMYSCLNSDPVEIDSADLEFTYKEAQLQGTINHVQIDHPGYDEYRYNLGSIGHDPIELISYLSAKYELFTFDMVSAELDSLFSEMYTFTTTEAVETRTRLETQIITSIDPETGEEIQEEVQVEVEYDYYILEIELVTIPFSSIVPSTLDSEQLGQYVAYTESKGGLQQFGTPFNINWSSYVSCYYGYRIGPTTNELELHRGLDIAMPEGTEIMAVHTGTVITASFDSSYGNYVVITDDRGFTTKYAHLSSIRVAEGQILTIGEVIGEVGTTGNSTGNHLHIEVLYNGDYYNPLFYLNEGDGT